MMALLPGFLGTTTVGAKVLTEGDKKVWNGLLAEALIPIGSSISAIKKALTDMKTAAKSA